MPYVSRAGDKLAHALAAFQISPAGLHCADFGCSTGGFVDCLLQQGAQQVYAVDTGYGVLDWKLRNDARVVVLERTNGMHVELPQPATLITIDTSWTRLENVVPNALNNLAPAGQIITLLKPHYQADQALLRNGQLPEKYVEMIVQETSENLVALGVTVANQTRSPVLGGKGKNHEYLLQLLPTIHN